MEFDPRYIDQLKEEFTEDYAGELIALCERYSKRAESIEYGRNRVVFLFKDYVIKLPITVDGLADNEWEGAISNAPDGDPDDIQLARTRMAVYNDVHVLFMERVKYATESYKDLPDWVGYVDCGQVGYNKAGRLVAYDYGIR